MKYPKCLSEAETVERAIAGANLARFGDGEFNLAIGRNCVSQKADPKLAAELRAILDKAPAGCLPCLPDPYGGTPKKANWQRYENFNIALGKQEFGSAFITRPDSAPWIDTAEYWSRMTALWDGKDIVFVDGSNRSLRPEQMSGAKSIRKVQGTYRDSYSVVDRIEEEIGKPSGPVILCLGPTATVLAARLAKKGVHAIDLGHLGMFMRHAGSYRFKPDDLISPEYRAMLQQMHREQDWGGSGHKQADAIAEFADEVGAKAILDYGSGQGYLAKALAARNPPKRVTEYDPGRGSVGLPKPSHLIVCSDVLEHIEPSKLDNVLKHIYCLADKWAYLVIATRLANKLLPDGRNAHLIVKGPEWWRLKIEAIGWKHVKPPKINEGHSITMWLSR